MPDTYTELLQHGERCINLNHVEWLLKWDQEVKMPVGGTAARSQQKSIVSKLEHEHWIDDRLGNLLDEVSEDELTGQERANVREIRRQHREATRVPNRVIEEMSRVKSESLPKWKEARKTDDFGVFEPYVVDLVDVERDYARHAYPELEPFAASFRRFEPYIDIGTVDTLLSDLKTELRPLIEGIRESAPDPVTEAFTETHPVEEQWNLIRGLLDRVGFDWDHGRLDVAPHPFASGTPYDARISVRDEQTSLANGVTTALHEFGHAAYTLGLPSQHYGTPLGEPRDYSIHEGIARFWENHIARSRPFWEWCLPIVKKYLPGVDSVSVDEAYRAVNEVRTENVIRTAADELTYHMHIILRYELSSDLLNGRLDVKDIPAYWNEKMQSYLGVRPERPANGFMQDIHWSHSQFSYFPTYSIGSVFAAQLYDAAGNELPLESLIREGQFERINDWLADRVYSHGQRYTTDDLIEQATGRSIDADPFVEYIESKYGPIYGL